MDKIGFAYTREFYSPDYSLYPELNKNEADNRLTLYWNPKIKKSKKGDYQIEFHNNDNTKAFKLIIQGIDQEGNLIFTEKVFQ